MQMIKLEMTRLPWLKRQSTACLSEEEFMVLKCRGVNNQTVLRPANIIISSVDNVFTRGPSTQVSKSSKLEEKAAVISALMNVSVHISAPPCTPPTG